MKLMHVRITDKQHKAITDLAKHASTSASDVLRQLLAKHCHELDEALEIWRTRGGLFNPHGNTARKHKRKKLGIRAL